MTQPKYFALGISAFVIITIIFIGGCIRRNEIEVEQEKKNEQTVVPVVVNEHLNPQALSWDGKNFWTAHEPGWEMADEIKPGHSDYKALIFKHADDKNKTIIEMYEAPHNFNVIGLVFINNELWTSSWINEQLGRIYRFKLENDTLKETGAWDTEVSCHGLAWDGSSLWCNMGPRGIVKFNITDDIKEVKRYIPSSELKPAFGGEVNAKGIAWDGKNLWTAYKNTAPVVIKHNMDENLSVAESYSYDHPDLWGFPGNITFVNDIFYSSSSDPGTGDFRGGRIVKHKMDESLSVDEIYFYNDLRDE